ncbi:MAG: hypothetical protein ACXV3F_01005 [Frankiaceae bacterium]
MSLDERDNDPDTFWTYVITALQTAARGMVGAGEEAADYLAGPMGLTLTAGDIETLADRTEGWAAALQLAGLSLQDRADPSAVVATFAGDDRFMVDYLADEVLVRQTDDVRDFLPATSVLDRLSGPLYDAVTGLSGSTARLVELERANLFLVPLDDRRQWSTVMRPRRSGTRSRLATSRARQSSWSWQCR